MRDTRNFLEDATRSWVDEGVITGEQREAILSRYPPEDKRKRQAAILSVLGAVLVGVGAILFVATNWEQVPRWGRLTLLVGSTLAAHAGGWQLKTRAGSYPRVGHALHILGTLLFGASLFLVAQLYNVNANAPWLLLLWLVGTAPMAWGMASRPILLLTIGIAALWLGFQTVEWVGFARDVYAPAAIMVPFFAFGALLWGFGRAHRRWDRLAHVADFDPILRGFGAIGLAAGLYVFTFDLPDPTAAESGFVAQLLALTLAFVAVGVAGAAWWALGTRRTHRTLAWAEAASLAALSLLMLVTALAPDPVVNAILFNLVLAGFILGLVMLGVQRGDELLINLGLLFFVVDVITRYFDFFFDLLDRSIFFIVGGLILLGGGWLLERSRKELVGRAREVAE